MRFAAFEFDPVAGELRKQGLKLKIEGQPLQVLQVLLEKPGQLVTREEMQRRLWPSDTFVDFEQGINSAIKRLRQALDDSAQTPRFIETLPRRGYRFVYPIPAAEPGEAARPEDLPRPRQAARWAIFAAACLAAIVGAVAVTRYLPPSSEPGQSGATIVLAVLPFENLTGDAGQEPLLREIQDELIGQLNGIRAIRVVGRRSADTFREKNGALSDIAAVLNVDAVLLGEARRQGHRWYLTAYLVSARGGNRLWSEGYERADRELQLLPGQVAREVAARLDVALTPEEEARLAKARQVDPAVYAACANGHRHMQQWTADGVERAILYFNQAIDLDATYAKAWAGLGEAYLLQGDAARAGEEAGMPDEAVRRRAEAALVRALHLDPTLRGPHQALGRLKFQEWDWAGGAREFQLAKQVEPNHPGFPTYLLAVGSFQEAIEAQRAAARLDPLNYASQLTVGFTAFMAGQFDDAIQALKATIRLSPDNPHGHRELAWAYAGKAMYEEAIGACSTALDLMRKKQQNADVSGGCEWVYARAGRREDALGMARLIERSPSEGARRFLRLAHVYDALGERERALACLRQAYDEKAPGLPFQWYSPMLSGAMKADGRFQDLIRRTGNPWARFPGTQATALINRPVSEGQR